MHALGAKRRGRGALQRVGAGALAGRLLSREKATRESRSHKIERHRNRISAKAGKKERERN